MVQIDSCDLRYELKGKNPLEEIAKDTILKRVKSHFLYRNAKNRCISGNFKFNDKGDKYTLPYLQGMFCLQICRKIVCLDGQSHSIFIGESNGLSAFKVALKAIQWLSYFRYGHNCICKKSILMCPEIKNPLILKKSGDYPLLAY